MGSLVAFEEPGVASGHTEGKGSRMGGERIR